MNMACGFTKLTSTTSFLALVLRKFLESQMKLWRERVVIDVVHALKQNTNFCGSISLGIFSSTRRCLSHQTLWFLNTIELKWDFSKPWRQVWRKTMNQGLKVTFSLPIILTSICRLPNSPKHRFYNAVFLLPTLRFGLEVNCEIYWKFCILSFPLCILQYLYAMIRFCIYEILEAFLQNTCSQSGFTF